MSLRPPQNLSASSFRVETGANILDAEILSEKAASLGRAGTRVEAALAKLNDARAVEDLGRDALLKDAADAVWTFFIQREACGLRDQRAIIADMKIPRAVLARLGAR